MHKAKEWSGFTRSVFLLTLFKIRICEDSCSITPHILLTQCVTIWSQNYGYNVKPNCYIHDFRFILDLVIYMTVNKVCKKLIYYTACISGSHILLILQTTNLFHWHSTHVKHKKHTYICDTWGGPSFSSVAAWRHIKIADFRTISKRFCNELIYTIHCFTNSFYDCYTVFMIRKTNISMRNCMIQSCISAAHGLLPWSYSHHALLYRSTHQICNLCVCKGGWRAVTAIWKVHNSPPHLRSVTDRTWENTMF